VTPVSVREARDDELDAAGAVVAAAYSAPGVLGDGGHGYLDHVRDARGRARDCPVLVAVGQDAGELLGCVTYVPHAGNPFAEVEVEGEAGFRMLGVAVAAQGRGVGRSLVEACIDRARADGRLGLAISTGPGMTTAHRLYERLGFRRAPDRDFEPVPGILLWAYVLPL
jgi:ribosomal protein S18 acetylase RimI-like enzyme